MTILAWQRAGPEPDEAIRDAVLLLHRWAADGAGTWGPSGWVEALASAGLPVLVPDLPGHGASADVPLPEGREPAAWTAGLLLADLEKLARGPFAVVGHGDMGPVAGHLAASAPWLPPEGLQRRTEGPAGGQAARSAGPSRLGVQRLVLISCDDRVEVPHAATVAAALRDAGARVWNPDAADLLARARSDQRHDPATLATWLEHRRWPAAPRLGALRIPVLLAVGTEDQARPRVPRLGQLFHDARVVTVPGDAEQVITSPQLVSQVTAFLQGH